MFSKNKDLSFSGLAIRIPIVVSIALVSQIVSCSSYSNSRCESDLDCRTDQGEICDDIISECVCENDCETVGALRCNEERVQECVITGSKCLLWRNENDCTDGELSCIQYNDVAVCAEVAEWVEIEGGSFYMGSDEGIGEDDERPRHMVEISSFSIARTEVTVSQYRECVELGACTEPGTEEYCNWGQSGRDGHPINCIDWTQAVEYCESWLGGRLPSESEWEYAARNQGQDITYPWGDSEPSCQYAVMNESPDLSLDEIYRGCEEGITWPVCSKPDGNTAQGLCDMSGNVCEWVQDFYHDNYEGAPADGSAWGNAIPYTGWGIRRGGSFFWSIISYNHLRTAARDPANPERQYPSAGFRCALDAE